MLLSLVLSILRKKKWTILWAGFILALCNAAFFAANVQKEKLVREYTAKGEVLTEGDVILFSSDSVDMLQPKAFEFPHMGNILSHGDVQQVSSLAIEGENFIHGGECPELILISLKKGANIKKWVDTLQTKNEYVAIHSSQYRQLYNKAIMVRNKALYGHYSLLSSIAFFSLLGIILSAANLAIKVRHEISSLLSEGVSLFLLLFWFGFCLSKIAGIITFIICGLQYLQAPFVELLFKWYLQVCCIEVVTIFASIAVLLLVKRRGVWVK